jgi:hypothetical protein
MAEMISGAIGVGCWVAGLFFFSFSKKTGDRLLYFFGISFWLLGAERVIPILAKLEDEPRTYLYLVRLLAFALILYAIWDKNRGTKRIGVTLKG